MRRARCDPGVAGGQSAPWETALTVGQGDGDGPTADRIPGRADTPTDKSRRLRPALLISRVNPVRVGGEIRGRARFWLFPGCGGSVSHRTEEKRRGNCRGTPRPVSHNSRKENNPAYLRQAAPVTQIREHPPPPQHRKGPRAAIRVPTRPPAEPGAALAMGRLRWLCAVLLALPGLAWGDCPPPPRFVFAEPTKPLNESYAEGDRVRYRCRPGYMMAAGKVPEIICEAGSRWSENPDFCIGKSCREPEIPNGNFEYSTDLQFGATINFTCNEGYRLVGASSAQCVLKDNEVYWSEVPHCDIIPCPPPPGIENGKITSGDRDFVFGMVATYRCDKNFALIGDDMIHCTTDDNLEGKWSGPAPECKVVRCENPQVKNGRKVSGFGTEYTYKNTVTFECDPGHILKGSSVVTCEADSTWNPPLPTCDPVYCGSPPRFTFAELSGAAGDRYLADTRLMYHCKPGYVAAEGKSSVVTCQMDSTWSADLDFCIRQQCPPPRIENGYVIADNFLFETVVTFTCHSGYELKKPSAKCVASGNGVDWDPAAPYCEKKRPDSLCEEPPTIDNGMHNGTQGTTYLRGSVVVYKCRDGFTLAGAASIRCVVDQQQHGVWSKPTPECKRDDNPVEHVLCGKPPTIDNGVHNGTQGTTYLHGSVVVYKCRDGFTLAGAASIRCMAGDQARGVWSMPLPECRGGANIIIVGIFPLLLAMLVMNI